MPAVRLPDNPIIGPDLLPAGDGGNINGPSLIRVPAWVPRPLGRYYLYFGHHGGKYIRLAYADRVAGPWRVHAPGTLRLEQAAGCRYHIASPCAVVDEQRRQIRLYFHGPVNDHNRQDSFVALSGDGLSFEARPASLGPFYFAVFRRPDAWYAMSWGGRLHRSADGLEPFVAGHTPLAAGVRHVGVDVDGERLWAYFSRIGDTPERILRSRIDLAGDWTTWTASEPEEVLRPERDWEGADLPLAASQRGAAKGRENALRDPAVFVDDDGRRYLLYSVAGESGIAIAELS